MYFSFSLFFNTLFSFLLKNNLEFNVNFYLYWQKKITKNPQSIKQLEKKIHFDIYKEKIKYRNKMKS